MNIKNLILLIVVAICGYALILTKCKRDTEIESLNSKTILTKKQLERIIEIAYRTKVVVKDTIIYKNKIIIKDKPVPVPTIINDSTRIYTDHIVNGDIDIIINDSIRGSLLKRDFTYTPIVKVQTIETFKYIPEIVPVEIPNRYKLSIGVITSYDYTNKKPYIGGEIGIINKKDISINYQYQNNLQKNIIHSIRISKNIKL